MIYFLFCICDPERHRCYHNINDRYNPYFGYNTIVSDCIDVWILEDGNKLAYNLLNFHMIKILILDDSQDLLDAMKIFFEKKDLQVNILSNHQHITEEIENYNPDILLLDIILPLADGREICKKLRENPKNKNLCIMLISSSPKILKEYKNYGADGCIEKPFDFQKIIGDMYSVLITCKDEYPPLLKKRLNNSFFIKDS